MMVIRQSTRAPPRLTHPQYPLCNRWCLGPSRNKGLRWLRGCEPNPSKLLRFRNRPYRPPRPPSVSRTRPHPADANQMISHLLSYARSHPGRLCVRHYGLCPSRATFLLVSWYTWIFSLRFSFLHLEFPELFFGNLLCGI